MSPTTLLIVVCGSDPTQARGTIGLDNTNLCIEDDIVELVENDKTDMLVPENNGVASNDENSTKTQEGETLPQPEKGSKNPLQMKNQTNQGITISLMRCNCIERRHQVLHQVPHA